MFQIMWSGKFVLGMKVFAKYARTPIDNRFL